MRVLSHIATKSSLVFLSVLLSMNSAYSALSLGYYGGIQLGVADTNISDLNSSDVNSDVQYLAGLVPGQSIGISGSYNGAPFYVPAQMTSFAISNPISVTGFQGSTTNHVLAGRLFVGYQFSDLFALELGFLTFKNSSASYNATTVIPSVSTVNVLPGTVTAIFNNATRKDTISYYGPDITAKIILPVRYNFSLYTRLGVICLFQKTETELTVSNPSNIVINPPVPTVPNPFPGPVSATFSTTTSDRDHLYRPIIGIGAGYDVTETFNVDISWYRIILHNNASNNIDLIMGGLILRAGI